MYSRKHEKRAKHRDTGDDIYNSDNTGDNFTETSSLYSSSTVSEDRDSTNNSLGTSKSNFSSQRLSPVYEDAVKEGSASSSRKTRKSSRVDSLLPDDITNMALTSPVAASLESMRPKREKKTLRYRLAEDKRSSSPMSKNSVYLIKSIDYSVADTSSSLAHEEIDIPVYISLIMLLAYVLFGGLIFSLWKQDKDFDFLVACYFSFITLSTIGFGDFVFGDKHGDNETELDTGQLIGTGLYIFFGLAFLSMCIDLMLKGLSRMLNEIRLGFWERFERYGQENEKRKLKIKLLKRELEQRPSESALKRRMTRRAIRRNKKAQRLAAKAKNKHKVAHGMFTSVSVNEKIFPRQDPDSPTKKSETDTFKDCIETGIK